MRLAKLELSVALLPLLIAGCGSPGLFEWGAYEDSVYRLCATPDSADIDADIQRLSELVERAATNERPVGPGVHAHLGFLYSLAGDDDSAAAALLAEKDAYPESAVFVDGLLARFAEGSR